MTGPRNELRHPPVRVGTRQAGQVAAWLVGHGDYKMVVMNVAYLGGMAVHVSLDDTALLRDGLTRLLRQAGHE